MNLHIDSDTLTDLRMSVKNRADFLRVFSHANASDQSYKDAEFFGLLAELGESAARFGLIEASKNDVIIMVKKLFNAWLALHEKSDANTNKEIPPLNPPLAQVNESLKIIAEKLSDIAESLDYIAATKPDGEV